MVLDTALSDPESVVNAYKSSEQTAYPVSNAYDLERRRKVWRTNGYWDIQSGSNTIVFQESAGVNLTATIPAAEYTSTTSLMAAIKTALEDAGVATYTVAQDTTTGRIKITSNLGGGATVFRLMWTSATGFGDTIGFDTSADDTGASTYTADLLRIHTSEWLKWDLGIPTNPTALVCMGDRNIPMQISATATIKLQGSHTDNWTSPGVDLTLTPLEFVLGYQDPDGIAGSGSGGFRYWRLVIQDQDNPVGYLQFGVVFLGIHVDISRGCPEFPLEMQGKDLTTVQVSEAGQIFAGRRPKTETIVLNWAKLDVASCEALNQVWEQYGQHTNFLIAMDPDEVFSSDGNTQIRLVRFDAEPTRRLVSPGNFSYTWQLKEAL